MGTVGVAAFAVIVVQCMTKPAFSHGFICSLRVFHFTNHYCTCYIIGNKRYLQSTPYSFIPNTACINFSKKHAYPKLYHFRVLSNSSKSTPYSFYPNTACLSFSRKHAYPKLYHFRVLSTSPYCTRFPHFTNTACNGFFYRTRQFHIL